LSNNNFNNFEKIIKSIPSNLKKLNLSNNKLGLNGGYFLVKNLSQKNNQLTTLNLERNNLGDEVCADILNIICENNIPIINLCLAKNKLSAKSSFKLSKLLNNKFNLQSLDLHYNKIIGDDFICILKSLNDNIKLKVLDISYNTIGKIKDKIKYTKSYMAEKFSEMVTPDSALKHKVAQSI
jgi:hypothetical protein